MLRAKLPMPTLSVSRNFIVHYAMVGLIFCEEIFTYAMNRLCVRYNYTGILISP